MKVAVYFNLHRKCFSIRSCEGPTKGLVIAHANDVLLDEVTFKVSEAGRLRVRRERKKNVHAFVCGELMAWGGPQAYATEAALREGKPFPLAGKWSNHDEQTAIAMINWEGERFTYNPYKHDTFVTQDGVDGLHEAERAMLSTTHGSWVVR